MAGETTGCRVVLPSTRTLTPSDVYKRQILPTGAVFACRRVQNSRVGNALHDRLVDLWLGPVEAYRQYGRFAKCARCELLAFCRGCPAVASGKSGDFYAPDPQCWKEV